MSSDNWREAKRGGNVGEEGMENDDGDWRRAGPRDKGQSHHSHQL